jgi:Mg/Co/Ni transporter MgtE
MIKGLIKGEITKKNAFNKICLELMNGLIIAFVVTIAAFLRVVVFSFFSSTVITIIEELTVAVSIFCIVIISGNLFFNFSYCRIIFTLYILFNRNRSR